MKTVRTILLILGVLVAGAALNVTFAQEVNDELRLEKHTYRSKHDHVKIKSAKHKDKGHKGELKKELKGHQHQKKHGDNHALKAGSKGDKYIGKKDHKHALKAGHKSDKHNMNKGKIKAKREYKADGKKWRVE